MSASTTAKTAALSVLAVAQHAAEHHLTLNGIDTPAGSPSSRLRVRVAPTDLHLWVDTLRDTEKQSIRPLNAVGSAWETIVYAGHIDSPLGSVAVEVSTTRKVVSPVRAVPSGVAS